MQPVQVAYFKPIQVWKDKNKTVKHMGKLPWEKTREDRCLLHKQGGAIFTSELDDTAIKDLFCWWEHDDRHRAFAVREVPADHCCMGPTGAYGCNLGNARPSLGCAPLTQPLGAPLLVSAPKTRILLLTLPQPPPAAPLPTSTLYALTDAEASFSHQ